jgi:hypothetical protein
MNFYEATPDAIPLSIWLVVESALRFPQMAFIIAMSYLVI